MNTSVAVAEIASKTVLWLALIGAGVRLLPPLLAKLQITSPRGQSRQAAKAGPAVVLEGQGDETGGV